MRLIKINLTVCILLSQSITASFCLKVNLQTTNAFLIKLVTQILTFVNNNKNISSNLE